MDNRKDDELLDGIAAGDDYKYGFHSDIDSDIILRVLARR